MINLYSLSFNNLDGRGEGVFKRERRGTYPVPGVQIVQCDAKSESGKRNKKGKRERNFVDLRVTKFKVSVNENSSTLLDFVFFGFLA